MVSEGVSRIVSGKMNIQREGLHTIMLQRFRTGENGPKRSLKMIVGDFHELFTAERSLKTALIRQAGSGQPWLGLILAIVKYAISVKNGYLKQPVPLQCDGHLHWNVLGSVLRKCISLGAATDTKRTESVKVRRRS